jgi:ribose transport system substrate-binding protein
MTRDKLRGLPRFVLGSLMVAAMLTIAACGSDDSSSGSGGSTTGGGSSDKKAKIAFFGLSAENAYTKYMYDAAKAAGGENNAEVVFFDGKFEGPAQIAQVQDAITSGQYDGMIVMPNDTTGMVPATKQAIAKGIKVAALQFPIGPSPTDPKPQVDGLTTSVIEDVVSGANITAKSINDMCKDRDPCEVGLLWGSRKLPWDGAAKRPEMLKTLDPNVKIVAEADANFLQPDGEKATADMLQAHASLDVLATPSGDQMTLGGERAIVAAGKKTGLADRPEDAIAIVGYGASKAGVEKVGSGDWYSTYALVPESMSKTATEYLLNGIRGQPVKSNGIGQVEISPIGDNITAEILERNPDFQAEWEG